MNELNITPKLSDACAAYVKNFTQSSGGFKYRDPELVNAIEAASVPYPLPIGPGGIYITSASDTSQQSHINEAAPSDRCPFILTADAKLKYTHSTHNNKDTREWAEFLGNMLHILGYTLEGSFTFTNEVGINTLCTVNSTVTSCEAIYDKEHLFAIEVESVRTYYVVAPSIMSESDVEDLVEVQNLHHEGDSGCTGELHDKEIIQSVQASLYAENVDTEDCENDYVLLDVDPDSISEIVETLTQP